MDTKRAWSSVDIAFALLLIALCVYVIAESLATSLPMVDSGQATWLDMPGLSPIVCAVLLIGMSIGMMVGAYRQGGRLRWFVTGDLGTALASKEARVVYLVFAILGAYVFLLWPRLPFWLSTTVFLVAFMAIFRVRLQTALVVAVLTAATLWFVFVHLFNVALPSRFVLGG